jgi:hypothetical protein
VAGLQTRAFDRAHCKACPTWLSHPRPLRFLSTEAPSLHRSYPASSVQRASPPSQTARPVSRELPVDPRCDHRWDFPCCVWSPLPTCRRQYPDRFDGTCSLVPFHQLRPSLDLRRVGSCISGFEACTAFTLLRPACSPSRLATLCTRGFSSLVASTAALIATGWSEPVPGRVYPRCGPPPFHGALRCTYKKQGVGPHLSTVQHPRFRCGQKPQCATLCGTNPPPESTRGQQTFLQIIPTPTSPMPYAECCAKLPCFPSSS